MKIKKLMLVTFLLLAILTIGAVSASDDSAELSHGMDDALTVEDSQEDLAENPAEESVAGDDADDVLSYEASDFNVEINESMDIRYENAAAITFTAPDDANGEILVGVNRTDERYVFDLDDTPITLGDLWIEKTGTYSIYVYFSYTDDGEIYHEISLLNGTIDVSQTIMAEDFDCDYWGGYEYYPIDDLSYHVFDLYDSPADGNLIVFVDNRKVYEIPVCVTDFEEYNFAVTSKDLKITGENSTYHITVIFNTTEGEEFTLAEFNAYYDISNSQEPCFIKPNFVAAGEVSYIVFNPPGNFLGNVTLYNVIYNEETEMDEIGSLIMKSYPISASAREVPLPALTPGVHYFYLNYTIDGESDAGFIYVVAIENSQNLSSSISSAEIDAGDPLTVTVTGPKEGYIDFYVDMKHVALYSMENGTVEHTFSDLTQGTHVISVSYDNQEINDLFYEKEFLVTVSNTSGTTTVDNSVDSSTTEIYGELILTDIATRQVFKRNITLDLIKSSWINPGNYSSKVTEILNHLISLARTLIGDKKLTVKTQNVSANAHSRYNNTSLHWIDQGMYSYREIRGEYGTKWIVNVTVIAEYASETIDISNVKMALSKNAFTYNAKVQKPTVTLTNGAVLKEGVDYTLQWSAASPKNAGTYTITVTGTGAYTGTAKSTFVINKAANPLAVKAKTVTVKFTKLKKKAQKLKVTKAVKFTKKGQGTLTYKKVKGNKKIAINKKTGKITIKKGLKKGTYKVKVKIKAKGNANYKASAFKTVTFKIKIK